MLALQSYTGSISGVVGVSFRQAIIPDALMGRVSSAFRLYALGAMAVGAFVGGMLAHFVELLAPYWLSALAMVALSFALWPVMNNRTMAVARQAAARQAAALGEQDQVESTQSRP
jgi:MFS family permease